MTKRKYTPETVPVLFIESGRNDEYELLDCSKVKNNKSKICVKHKICNYVYDVAVQHFFNTKSNCGKCANRLPIYTSENFINIFNNDRRCDEYELLDYSDIKDEYSRFLIKHKVCGHIYSTSCTNFFLSQSRCPNCSGNYSRYTIDRFLQTWGDFSRSIDYILIDYSQVKNKNTKFTVQHRKCGYIYKVACHNFFYMMSGCPKCKSSHGEDEIYSLLSKNNVDFCYQYQIDGCRKVNPLKFDFFATKKNAIIEYHGVQHYKPVDFFGGQRGFEKRKEYDLYKKQFALSVGHQYIEIPFYDFRNIQQILEKHSILNDKG